MKRGSLNIFLTVSVLLGVSACVPKRESLQTNVQFPASFRGGNDSSNAAHRKWNEYFGDTVLQALIEEALRNNPDQLAALQKIEASTGNLTAAKGALLPAVSANAAYSARKFGLYTMDGAGNISTTITPGQIVPIHLPDHYIGILTSWEVDIWGKLRSRRKAAFNRYLSSVEARNLIVTNLVAEVAAGYYELLQLDNALDIIRETIRLQSNALEIVVLQKETGLANELAVEQFRAQVLNSTALEYDTRQRISAAENRLNFLLGRFPQPVPRNKESFDRSFAFNPEQGIPSELLGNRPDIRRAEYDLAAANADLAAARAAFYPSLSITGSLGLQSFKTALLLETPESVAYALFANMTAPLVNRSALRGNYTRVSAAHRAALVSYRRSVLNGIMEVSTELSNIGNLDSIAAAKSEEMYVLSQAAETAGELYLTGRATYIEVLMAQKNSLAAGLDLLEVKKRQYHAYINIYKALGGGWR